MLTPALASFLDSLNRVQGESLTEVQRAIRRELTLLDQHLTEEALKRAVDILDTRGEVFIAGVTYGPNGKTPCKFCNATCP
jgi:DNA-binding MurR/RpiR family transcriptional regulator